VNIGTGGLEARCSARSRGRCHRQGYGESEEMHPEREGQGEENVGKSVFLEVSLSSAGIGGYQAL
jgi:hypothetical protein